MRTVDAAKWEAHRELRLLMDKRTCQTCGRSTKRDGVALEVHHNYHPSFAYAYGADYETPDNLITLCVECHKAVTAVRRRSLQKDVEIVPQKSWYSKGETDAEVESEVHWREVIVDAQRQDGKSDGFLRQRKKEVHSETGKQD